MKNKKTTFDKLYNKERKRKKNKIKIKFMQKNYIKKIKKIIIKEIKRSFYQKDIFFINVKIEDLKKVDLACENILCLIDKETNHLYFQNFTYKQHADSFYIYSVKDMNEMFENFYKIKQEEEVKK